VKLFLLILACIHLTAFAEEIRFVSVNEISPTQTAVGKAEIEGMILDWASRVETQQEFRALLSSKIQSRVSPGFVAPCLWDSAKQAHYIKDGHHRAAAVHKILYSRWDELPPRVQTLMDQKTQLSWQSAEDLKIKLVIEERYSNLDELLNSFRTNSFGQIPPELQTEKFLEAKKNWKMKDRDSRFKTLLGVYQRMAPNLSKLQDNPWRSAVGSTFFELGIRGEFFENYIEFKVAEEIQKHYPSLERYLKDPISKASQEKFARIILNDPNIKAVLQENLREEARKEFSHLWQQLSEKKPQVKFRTCGESYSYL
jgi:hypothetical protein